MKNRKTTKICSILLLISIIIAGLSNGFTYASEKSSQSSSTETCESKCVTGEEIFNTIDETGWYFFKSPDPNVYVHLRGDTHLFYEIKDTFRNIKFSSYEEFEKLFYKKFEEITKTDINVAISNFKPIYVAKYDFDGISGGVVTPYLWFEIFLPCVKNICFDKFNYTDNSNDCVNNIYFLLNPKDDTATVLGRKDNNTRIRIPAFLKHNKRIYKVTEIAKKAFFGNRDLCEVIFEGHINKIGDSAFDKTNLNFIDMHKGVDNFGKDAFLRIPCYAKFIVPKGKEEEYAKKLKKDLKCTEICYTYSGKEEVEYDLFIGANSKYIG